MRTGRLLLAAMTVLSCAKMVAPGGGPEDDTSPEIVEVVPPPGTGYDGLDRITVYWSERLEQASAIIFLYPSMEYDLDVSGSSMRIDLSSPVGDEPLVINLPGEIADRRGNRVEESENLVYTSADTLPSGGLEVAASRQGGGSLSRTTLVELYRDSVLMRRTVPDTSAVAGIYWLEPGGYRLRCYEDPDRSYTWDSQLEAGIDTQVTLASADTLRLEVTLTVVDTLGPVLSEVNSLDAYHPRMMFNEEVSYESFGEGEVSIRDSLGEPVPVNGYWLTGGTSAPSVILSTGKMPDGLLTAYLEDVEDLMGNPAMSDSMEFYGTDSLPSDSLRIRSYYPPEGSDNADPGGPFRISFNYWVHPDTLENKLVLERVVDSTTVRGSIRVVDGRSFEYYPDHQLIGEQQYRFLLEPGIATEWGDTLTQPFSWSFSTLWGDEPGSMAGKISGAAGAPVILRISRTGGDTDARITYEEVGRGDYTVDEVPAGRYTVAAFVDRDGDGIWSPTEAYGTYPGVVMVQPGLITRDVDIEILP